MTAWVLTVLTACTLNTMSTSVDFEEDFANLIKSQKQTASWIENGAREKLISKPPSQDSSIVQDETDTALSCVATFSI